MKTTASVQNLIPKNATHPGTLIADELEVREDLNQKELAHLLDMKTTFLNEIIKGKRPISADTAILLEKALGISADFWLKFQTQYDLDLARIKEKNIKKVENIEFWNIIKNYIPVSAVKKLGYISENIEENIKSIYSIFSVNNINDFVNQFATRKFSYYRKSQKLTIDEKNLFTWSAITEFEASKKIVEKFDADKKEELIKELNPVFLKNKNVLSLLEKMLSKYGIKLIILKKFSKTPVDGYSFWSGDNPAIALSCRYDRIDYIAFTLMHELGHVFLHLSHNKAQKFLDIDEKEKNVYEDEADDFARKSLIKSEIWTLFKQNKFPVNDKVISEFAKTYKIHPAIIHGRMCFESKNFKSFTTIDKHIG